MLNDPQNEAPDELDQIAADSPDNDPAIQALKQTDPEAAYKLEIAKLKGQNEKLIGRQRAVQVNQYRDQLIAQEFPLAPPEAVTGTTKAEVRRNAERAHNGTLAVLKSLGLTPEQVTAQIAARAAGAPAGTQAAPPAARVADPRAAQWGSPPPVASDTVSGGGEQLKDWNDVNAEARDGRMSRSAVLAELRKNGPRVIEQPTLALAARRASGGQAPGSN